MPSLCKTARQTDHSTQPDQTAATKAAAVVAVCESSQAEQRQRNQTEQNYAAAFFSS